MTAKVITQCILQAICVCFVYEFDKKADVCFGPDPSYKQFATKTPYTAAIADYVSEAEKPLVVPDGCKPSLFYNFQRHTVRNPNTKDILISQKELPDVQKELKENKKESNMCKRDIKSILEWNQPFSIKTENEVVEAGRVTVREQVKRLRSRFPTIFAKRAPLQNMVVDYSNKGNRTRDTAEAFLREWFGDETFDTDVNKKLVNVSSLNTFHETCEKIMAAHNITINSLAHEVVLESRGYHQLKKTISRRLGFKVHNKQIKAMLTQCQFETAIMGSSPWCAVFDDEEFKLLELLKDVKDYDTDGYGYEMNRHVGCPVAVDLLSHIRSLTPGDQNLTKAVLHFSHAGALKKLPTLFGFGERLNSDCQQRSWWTSKFVPFNTNINVVYYSCSAGEDRVAFLANEKMKQLKECSDLLCTADEFTKILQSKASGCDEEKICSKL